MAKASKGTRVRVVSHYRVLLTRKDHVPRYPLTRSVNGATSRFLYSLAPSVDMKAFVVVMLNVVVESAHLQWQEVVIGVRRTVVASSG